MVIFCFAGLLGAVMSSTQRSKIDVEVTPVWKRLLSGRFGWPTVAIYSETRVASIILHLGSLLLKNIQVLEDGLWLSSQREASHCNCHSAAQGGFCPSGRNSTFPGFGLAGPSPALPPVHTEGRLYAMTLRLPVMPMCRFMRLFRSYVRNDLSRKGRRAEMIFSRCRGLERRSDLSQSVGVMAA